MKSRAPAKARLVLLNLPRSPEPPTSQGIFCARALRTLPELSRVAMPLGSAGKLGRFLSQPSGRARFCILLRRAAGFGDFFVYSGKRTFHLVRPFAAAAAAAVLE